MRLVLGMDVVCRAAPNRAAAPVLALGLGESVLVRATANDQESGTWYEVAGPPRPCWLFAALTVPFAGFEDPDRALISIADHALALQPKATFEHLVAVDNLLLERKRRSSRYYRAPATVTPLLDLRHLQVINGAARAIGGQRTVRNNPLRDAWVLAHPDVVSSFDPGDLYHVRSTHFWLLHERHAASPVAEEIA